MAKFGFVVMMIIVVLFVWNVESVSLNFVNVRNVDSRCSELLGDVLVVDVNVDNGAISISDDGRVLLNTQLEGSVLWTKESIVLSNGVTSDVTIYLQDWSWNIEGYGSDRLDFIVDTHSWRSSNPTSNNYAPTDVCILTFAELQSSNARNNKRNVQVCNVNAVSYDEAVNQLRSLEFSSSRRDEIVDYLMDYMEMYVYKYIAIDSGDPFNVEENIIEDLERIRETNYDNDYEFHYDIRSAFANLHDLHTQYGTLSCISNWRFLQPFVVGSDVDEFGSQYLTIKNIQLCYDRDFNEFDPTPYIGWNIESINGQDPVEYVKAFADTFYRPKDISASFNFHLPKLTTVSAGSDGIPDSKTVQYVLVHPISGDVVEVDFDWIAQYVGSDNDCYKAPTFDSLNANPDINADTNVFASLNSLEGTGDSNMELIKVNSEIGTIRIPTFFQPDTTKFAATFSLLYTLALHKHNFDNLIIDLSFNGGGIVANGYFVAKILSAQAPEDVDDLFDYDLIKTDFFDDIIPFYWNNFDRIIAEPTCLTPPSPELGSAIGLLFDISNVTLAPDSDLPNPPESWYTDSVTYTRGGVRAEYSQKIELNNQFASAQANIDFFTSLFEYRVYDSSSLIVLTDGTCGSTCSIAAHALIDFGGSKLIGFGGLADRPLMAGIVPANIQSANFNEVLSSCFDALNFNTDHLPNPKPYSDLLFSQFAFREIYSSINNKDDLPLEYSEGPVRVRLNVWISSSDDRAEAYFLASEYFGCCFEDEDVDDCTPCDQLNDDYGIDFSSSSSSSFLQLSFILSFIFILNLI